jgi:hypothetical protein
VYYSRGLVVEIMGDFLSIRLLALKVLLGEE